MSSRIVRRPPFAQERLRLLGDERIALKLKAACHDGTPELAHRFPHCSGEAKLALTGRYTQMRVACAILVMVKPVAGAKHDCPATAHSLGGRLVGEKEARRRLRCLFSCA
jgi:hypothetical protein